MSLWLNCGKQPKCTKIFCTEIDITLINSVYNQIPAVKMSVTLQCRSRNEIFKCNFLPSGSNPIITCYNKSRLRQMQTWKYISVHKNVWKRISYMLKSIWTPDYISSRFVGIIRLSTRHLFILCIHKDSSSGWGQDTQAFPLQTTSSWSKQVFC